MGVKGLESFITKTPGADSRVFTLIPSLSKWLGGKILLVDYAGMYVYYIYI